MKNVIVFSGGTGSIALQTGFHKIYGEAVKLDIIISAYDNGKSTGECRKVFNNRILGPSDLRKNQLTQFGLRNELSVDTKGKEDKVELYNLFKERFSCSNWREAYEFCKTQTKDTFSRIYNLNYNNEHYSKIEQILLELIDYFFFERYVSVEKSVRKTILTTNFTDFSISNIFYAAAAAINGYSLSKAGLLMSTVLGIPNNVHLISDVDLFLHAETQSGRVISDEGVIVEYDNSEDPIVKTILLDEKGKQYIPWIDEDIFLGQTSMELIEKADVIIFSSGTQWSSLIPTYMHKGFKKAISASKAKKYLVMNNTEDKDMKGVGASDLIETISRYLPMDDVTIVLNTNAQPSMSSLCSKWLYQSISADLSEIGSKTHNGERLVSFIMKDYYRDYIDKPFYFFDFDDTIWSSSDDSFLVRTSQDNISLLYKAFYNKSIIISGNSDNHFMSLEKEFSNALTKSGIIDNDGVWIYCNGGNYACLMKNGVLSFRKCIIDSYNLNDDYYILTNLLLDALKSGGYNISIANFENRGNCILSIKPLVDRGKALRIITKTIEEHFRNDDGNAKYEGHINGRTTIDILNRDYNKSVCTSFIARELDLAPSDIVYVGDKTDAGNDHSVIPLGYTVLSVDDVIDFNVFAKTCLA